VRYVRSYEKSAQLYDIFDRKQNISFFASFSSAGRAVLDIGAGTGRIALPLAEKGIDVYCVEPSMAMLAEFVRKLTARKDLLDRITLIAGEATSFALRRNFPLAIMSGVFDHLLDDHTRMLALNNIREHLEDNGTFVFDVSTCDRERRGLTAAGAYTIGNKEFYRFVGSKMISKDIKEVRIVFEIREQGRVLSRIEEKGLVDLVDREKIHKLLSRSGFALMNEYGDFDNSAYEKYGDLLIIEARKKAD
jgi:SAM-dependent methyltransferase